ncbi:MAG: acetate--CoA ligase family protein, partial [Nannocystaceae bacterium]
CPTVGAILPEALSPAWPRWFRTWVDNSPADAPPPVVVPLGPPDVNLDRPGEAELMAAACAHTLESRTGPLVPVPALMARLILPASDAPVLSELDLALWRQARRGLPSRAQRVANTPQAPISGQPILAVLAAKARAQQQRAYELLQQPEPELEWPSEDLEARSLEVLRSAGEVLSDHESKVVLRGFGVEITRQAVAASASGAVAFADKIGYPVVLKAVSPDFRRKRELGALMLDLQTAASVRRGYAAIVRNLEEHAPAAHLDGVAVCEQIAEGLEVRCGAIALSGDAYAFYGMALGATGPTHPPMLAIGPLDWSAAMLLAGSILAKIPVPALRRRGDPQPETLAALYLRLNRLIETAEGRLLKVDLSPIRLLDDPRAYVTLDARITQKPHLEGL